MPQSETHIQLPTIAGKKLYFVSDAHFGLPNRHESRRREDLFVQWLEEIRPTAQAIFLVGDIFDFWWEYRRVVPAGFVRLLGKLAQLADEGVQLHFFFGNHDMWMRHNYLRHELGAELHPHVLTLSYNRQQFYITHGDGLGPGDRAYKLLKWGFRNRILQKLFSQLHPDAAQWIGQAWSSHRKYENLSENEFYHHDEFLYRHSQQILQQKHFDYFVYGHRHTPVQMPLDPQSQYVNLGDWLQHFTYGQYSLEQGMQILTYQSAFGQGGFPTQEPIVPRLV